jgi:hypothetical protein
MPGMQRRSCVRITDNAGTLRAVTVVRFGVWAVVDGGLVSAAFDVVEGESGSGNRAVEGLSRDR